MCRKWYLAILLLGENGAWSWLGRVDMDADEALQDVLWRRRRQRSHCAIFWLRSAWERRCRAHRRLGRLSFLPWRGNCQLRWGKSLWREWTTKRWRRKQFRVREWWWLPSVGGGGGNWTTLLHQNELKLDFLGSLISQLSKYIVLPIYKSEWLYSYLHIQSGSQKCPFLPNYSGPISILSSRKQACKLITQHAARWQWSASSLPGTLASSLPGTLARSLPGSFCSPCLGCFASSLPRNVCQCLAWGTLFARTLSLCSFLMLMSASSSLICHAPLPIQNNENRNHSP